MTRVLVIDDSPTARRMVRVALEPGGYEVLEASDGRMGVDMQRAKPCDIVITDLIMPEKEGFETIRELHREWPALEIIAISGGSPALDKQHLLRTAQCFGAARALAKPFTVRQLSDTVASALADATRKANGPGRTCA